jgi:cation transporter-like permease
VTVTTAPVGLTATGGRAVAAFARGARRAVARVATAARVGGATAIGAAGLASIAVGAGMVYLPAGFIVGGALAVWFASLLPGGKP